jgi:DNA-binding MarR family transcriptional regulator
MGRPPKLSAEEICQIVALHPEPVVTAADIHEEMDMTKRGAQARLKRLVEDGYLESKKVGSAAVVFWLTPQGREALAE